MGSRGPKPRGKISTKWTPDLAYSIGLITTDGCLCGDNGHIDLTSKDVEQLENFKKCLGLKVKIGSKQARKGQERISRVQFKDVLFYKFLTSIGLTPAKTKTIGSVTVPKKYFFDFIRGHLDGDGTFYSYWDKRWKNSFMFYTVFISASEKHIKWLRNTLNEYVDINGHVCKDGNKTVYQLKYAKDESLKLLKKVYYNPNVVCLSRKRLKIEKALDIVGEKL